MLVQQTVDRLHQLRLPGMAEAFLEQTRKLDYAELSFEERFSLLVEQEWLRRQNRYLSRLLKQARFRLPACVEDIDYHQARGLDRSVIKSLATCAWIRHGQNVLITGPTGVGKTYLACALGNAACRQGLSARYFRLPRLLSDLAIARGDGSYSRFLRQLAKTDLLILDEWGLSPFTESQARDLLEVIEDRHQLHSTIVVSQLPLEHWHSSLPDPTVADAILDRLIHNAHKIAMRGDSMRKILSYQPNPDEH